MAGAQRLRAPARLIPAEELQRWHPFHRAARERAQNHVRVPPTAREIWVAEITMAWPARYLRHDEHVLAVVQACTLARARGRDLTHAEHRLRMPGHRLRADYLRGLGAIAAGLGADNVAVF